MRLLSRCGSMRVVGRSLCALALAPVLALGAAACGRETRLTVVARIEGLPITRQALDRRVAILAGGEATARLPAARYRELREVALDALIASAWIEGEARARRIGVSAHEVERRVRAKEAAAPGGPVEFRSFLRATAQSIADVSREASLEILAQKLQRGILRGVTVTPSEVALYYHRHQDDFSIPEARRVEVANRKTLAEAEALRQSVESGASLLSRRQRTVGETSVTAKSAPGRRNQFEVAIYAARPRSLAGPILIGGHTYYLFRVIEVTPPSRRPLERARPAIRKLLLGERKRRLLTAAVAAWRAKWIALTDCEAGYLVQRCRGYRSARHAEDPAAFD